MAGAKKPEQKGAVLFQAQGAVYTWARELGVGAHGERLLLAQRTLGTTSEPRLLQCLEWPRETPPTPEEARLRRRLEDSVRLAGYLQHPSIARVYGLHAAPGALYVDREYVPGLTLNDLVGVALARDRFLPEPFLVYVGLQVAEALAHAHARRDEHGVPLGLIHRGLCPASIRVGPGGEVKLTDFGSALSRLPGRQETSVAHPRGSLDFAAPEAVFLEDLDARADLFSLGAVLLDLGTSFNLYSRPDVLESRLRKRLTRQDRAAIQKGLEAATRAGLPPAAYLSVAVQAATFQPEDVDRLGGTAVTAAARHPPPAAAAHAGRALPHGGGAGGGAAREARGAGALPVRGRHGVGAAGGVGRGPETRQPRAGRRPPRRHGPGRNQHRAVGHGGAVPLPPSDGGELARGDALERSRVPPAGTWTTLQVNSSPWDMMDSPKPRQPLNGRRPSPGGPVDVYSDLRELLFADEPLEGAAAWAAQQGPEAQAVWQCLAEVAARLQRGQTAQAIAELYRLLEDERADARNCFQAWRYLRQLGEAPSPEVARRVLGIVIEHSLRGGPEFLAAYWDGSARLLDAAEDFYGFVAPAPFMVAAVRRFLRTGRPLVDATPALSTPRAAPPSGARCRISVLTPAGRHECEDTWDRLWNAEVSGWILDAAGGLSSELRRQAQMKGLWSKALAPWSPRPGQDGGVPRVH